LSICPYCPYFTFEPDFWFKFDVFLINLMDEYD
jgi:hypothetical protein